MTAQQVPFRAIFFGLLVLGYMGYYAPFGINETDGGFLTGLAWQVLQGKTLYVDVLYVRPPLPVWWRALELQCLPESYAILAERWIFYVKMALYTWMGATLLYPDRRKWTLAILGFIVSAHCYPPMAWHTIDGLLYAVAAAFVLQRSKTGGGAFVAGAALGLSLMCKQSFYPLLPLFLLYTFFVKRRVLWWFGAGATGCIALIFFVLYRQHALDGFFSMTASAASSGQALQHGLLDYLRITPELALPGILLLAPVVLFFLRDRFARIALLCWSGWLAALPLSYAAVTWLRQDHTIPFAQSRALFDIAAALLFLRVWSVVPRFWKWNPVHKGIQVPAPAFILLGISWAAAVSWGFNLPLLFATPWIWAAMEIGHALWRANAAALQRFAYVPRVAFWGSVLVLLLSFRLGYEWIYRDGRRMAMHDHLGEIFPALRGIYSDEATAACYLELKTLAARYPVFKTLPAFPQSNFLTQTKPPLPLDWVVNRETNSNNDLIYSQLKANQPVIFLQKQYLNNLQSDPELEVSRYLFEHSDQLEETTHFIILQPRG